MAQLDLPFAEPVKRAFQPQSSEPAVRVARLSILREPRLSTVVRDIHLRRGLNILWAQPSPPGEARLNEGRLSGHTAGKTTFCRLIRYLLGEQRFAAPRVQERMRTGELRDGWVVGEVFVNGEPWVVGRPFALHIHPFAARGRSMEEAMARGGGFQDFLEALEKATMKPLPIKLLPASARAIDWPLLLTWLTRDQEARFRGIDEWRDPRSESDSPSPAAIDRGMVVRAVLGMVSDEEAGFQRQWEELDRAKDEIDRAGDAAAVRAADRRKRLASRLSLSEEALSGGELFFELASAELRKRREAAQAGAARLAEQRAAAERAEAEKDAAAGERDELSGQWKVLTRQRDARAAAPPAQAARRAPAGVREAHDDAGPAAAPGRCNVPIAVARERGCPLAEEAPRPVDAARLVRASSNEGAAGAAPVEEPASDAPAPDLDGEIAALEQAMARAGEVAREKREVFQRLAAELAAAQAEQAAFEAAVREAESLLREARAAEREVAHVEDRRRERAARMAEVSEKRSAERRAHQEAVSRLSERFESVLQALLGNTVRGRVDVSRDGIQPVVLAQGDRESVAMDTVKVLAFDLAALSLGFEGHGHFPGFLLHDGPREADMDQAIYERVFLYARQMEEAFSDPGQIGFQYIVTTTTPPPPSMARAPWLVDPVLDASTPEGRLLRMDL